MRREGGDERGREERGKGRGGQGECRKKRGGVERVGRTGEAMVRGWRRGEERRREQKG